MTDAPPRPSCRALALATLQAIVDARAQGKAVQAALRVLSPDASYWPINEALETAVVALLDDVLGADNIASYLLYECWRRPMTIRHGDRGYTIATVADVAAYLEAEYPEPSP